ncbi:hypothetical protein [Kitasatospora sp. NPDC094011]|uniref:hypothetical protein n=1 Tax=Kitasatospora sp. NPDC094011 TaxID=3364090 RepID=UPI003800D5C9
MTYSLQCSRTVEAVWDSLPQTVSGRLAVALARACDDPIGETQPWGVDDGVTRMLVLADVFAVLYLEHSAKVLHIYQIDYLG